MGKFVSACGALREAGEPWLGCRRMRALGHRGAEAWATLRAIEDEERAARARALEALAEHLGDDPETAPLLRR